MLEISVGSANTAGGVIHGVRDQPRRAVPAADDGGAGGFAGHPQRHQESDGTSFWVTWLVEELRFSKA